jgi:endoglucanase
MVFYWSKRNLSCTIWTTGNTLTLRIICGVFYCFNVKNDHCQRLKSLELKPDMRLQVLLIVSTLTYLIGTQKMSAEDQESYPTLTLTITTNSFLELSFQSESGFSYRILTRKDVISTQAWTSVMNIRGTGEEIYTNITASRTQSYYMLQRIQNPLYGKNFFVNTNSDAAVWVRTHAESDPENAALMNKAATNAWSKWLTGRERDVYSEVTNRMQQAALSESVAIFTLYNIPYRDCGSFSSGGAKSGDEYLNWITNIVEGLNTPVFDAAGNVKTNQEAVIIVEPDALAHLDCPTLLPDQKDERLELIKQANLLLKTPSTYVYDDAGHSAWQSVQTMVNLLRKVGITNIDGFALNVSNFQTDSKTITYGTAISKQLDDKHFIIDTSRNGLGPYVNALDPTPWCNPPGRALGRLPTGDTDNPYIDAFLWIKVPGESDGNCRLGEPPAGKFYPDYLLGLAERASY